MKIPTTERQWRNLALRCLPHGADKAKASAGLLRVANGVAHHSSFAVSLTYGKHHGRIGRRAWCVQPDSFIADAEEVWRSLIIADAAESNLELPEPMRMVSITQAEYATLTALARIGRNALEGIELGVTPERTKEEANAVADYYRQARPPIKRVAQRGAPSAAASSPRAAAARAGRAPAPNT